MSFWWCRNGMSTHRLSPSQMGEYLDMAYLKNPHYSDATSRIQRAHGSNSLYSIFGKGPEYDPKIIAHMQKRDPNWSLSPYLSHEPASPKAAIPWQQASRNSAGQQYDHGQVARAVAIASDEDIAEFDPRYLHGSQPSVKSEGVLHYLEHGQSGPLFADKEDIGNQMPFVYIHQGTGQMRLLGGHHRATSALLKAEPLVARYALGDY